MSLLLKYLKTFFLKAFARERSLRKFRILWASLYASLGLLFLSSYAFARGVNHISPPVPPVKPSQVGGAPIAKPLEMFFNLPDTSKSEIERFCGNIAIRANDTRAVLQIRKLAELKKDIEDRITELEEKRKHYEEWLKKRDDFLEKAKTSLVKIISKMKPNAAADQLSLVDDYTAASIILKLNPRVSSLIMNQMPAQKTANLTRIMVGIQRTTAPKTNTESAQGDTAKAGGS